MMITHNTTAPPDEQALVTSCISQKTTIELYPRTIKIKRPFTQEKTAPNRALTSISGFSENSRRNLRFKATNASHLLGSQFGLTYGQHWPTDGREFKRHLNNFLTQLRQQFPFLLYLWIAEFQSRNAPHVHVFLNITPTKDNREKLADIWCNLVNAPDKANMLVVHRNPKNFIAWKMGTGSYLCKYLDKASQKAIPAGFENFGRFWGNTRGLVQPPEVMTVDTVNRLLPTTDETTGETDLPSATWLLRIVGRYHEKHNRRSWFRKTNKSTSALTGAPIYRQALAYVLRTRNINTNPEPF